MKIKSARQIFTATLTGWLLVAIAVEPLLAEEPVDFDRSEYPYCCQDNRSNWGRGGYGRRYDFENLETLAGEVVSVETYSTGRGNSQGVHLLVNTGEETLEVHLGPSWYLESRDFAIAPKDKIAITGSRINFYGEPAIIARQIEKGNETLILRDEYGFPLWRGWRQ